MRNMLPKRRGRRYSCNYIRRGRSSIISDIDVHNLVKIGS